MSDSPVAHRRRRLAVVVGVCSAVVAVGVAGTGLLLPAGTGAMWVRTVGGAVAIGAGAVLVRLDGPARGLTSLAVVSTTALLVCVATLPVSPVQLPAGDGDGESRGAVPEDEATEGGEIVIEPGEGGGAAPGGSVVALPPDADIVIEDGQVLLLPPGGGRIVIGQATRDGATSPGGDTTLTLVDGVVTRDDGAPVGGDVPVGGTVFERGDGSRVAVGEGVLRDVPTPLVPDEPRTEPVDAILALLLGGFALLAFGPPLIRVGERSPVRLVDDETTTEPEPVGVPTTSMEEGLAGVLRAMLADPDPRTSVIGAYARLLTAMAEAGHPRRAEEGPHEHLWRTLGPLGVRRQPVHRLAELFVRARFTPRPVTEADRHAAIAALADAVADLRLKATDVEEAAARVGAVS